MKNQFIYSFFLIFAFVFPLFVLSASAQSLDESGNKNKEQLIDNMVDKIDDCFGLFGWRCKSQQDLITLSEAYNSNLVLFCRGTRSVDALSTPTPCEAKEEATCANLEATLLMLLAVFDSVNIEWEKKLTIPDLSRWMHQLSQSVHDLKKECYDKPGALHGWEPVER